MATDNLTIDNAHIAQILTPMYPVNGSSYPFDIYPQVIVPNGYRHFDFTSFELFGQRIWVKLHSQLMTALPEAESIWLQESTVSVNGGEQNVMQVNMIVPASATTAADWNHGVNLVFWNLIGHVPWLTDWTR